jgi:hypothetical protein
MTSSRDFRITLLATAVPYPASRLLDEESGVPSDRLISGKSAFQSFEANPLGAKKTVTTP